MPERIPPHDTAAEKAALGAAMLNEEALSDIMDVVSPSEFYNAAHKEIYAAMLALFAKSVEVDIVTVCDELKRRESLEIAGGRSYVASLPSDAPSSVNAIGYARIIVEKAMLRNLIFTADDIRDKSFKGAGEAESILDYAEQRILEVAQRHQSKNYEHIREIVKSNMDTIDAIQNSGDEIRGLTTGFKDLDEITAGLQKSDLIILAARPAMGKSAFALNVALNASKKQNATVAIFNLEMSKEQLSQRLLSIESRTGLAKIRMADLKPDDWQNISAAVEMLSAQNILIDDTAGIGVMEIKNKCRRIKTEYKSLDLIIVDYLQLMNVEGKSENRQQEISKLSRYLKLLAREMDCPVMVLSQLSREPEKRSDHKPMLSDLRESGSIEQDADVVMFLYRDEYYNKENSEYPNVCEVNVAKHRNGRTGKVMLAWREEYTQFGNYQQG